MSRDTTVISFRQPEAIDDPLTEGNGFEHPTSHASGFPAILAVLR